MDADGTREGFDLELLSAIRTRTSLPIIASGGAGSVEDFIQAARVGADALLAASVFHDQTLTIEQTKQALSIAGFEVRESA
jgi:cyclase